MRVVAFVNGELGRHACGLVRNHLVAVVITQGCDYHHGALLDKPWEVPFLYGDDPLLAEKLLFLQPTHGLSAGYRAILPGAIIDRFPCGIANVHTSLLPFNRGAHPNAWALFYDQPAGVTLHLIDQGVDTGPILAQHMVPTKLSDTADSLQARLIDEAKLLMTAAVPAWLLGGLYPTDQGDTTWPTHRKKDLESICIDGNRKYHGWEVFNILRARSYRGFPGALYTHPDGRRVRLRIEIEEDPCPSSSSPS